MVVILRLIIGLIFTVSGAEKILGPTQNFLYVIQGYDVLPPALAQAAALIFPWLEFFLGVFMLLGLWLTWSLRGIMLVSATFMLIVGQAIVRKLPLDNCGCFGDLVHLPLRQVICLDMAIFLSALLCLKNIVKTGRFSLDHYYD